VEKVQLHKKKDKQIEEFSRDKMLVTAAKKNEIMGRVKSQLEVVEGEHKKRDKEIK
jgi:hypothetical protein